LPKNQHACALPFARAVRVARQRNAAAHLRESTAAWGAYRQLRVVLAGRPAFLARFR
jgi:hypothetical protein